MGSWVQLRAAHCHVAKRTVGEEVVQTYMIVDRGDGAGYNVELTDAIGVRHTMLGFETEAEARVWIEQDRRGPISAAQVSQSRASHSGSSVPGISPSSSALIIPMRSADPMR